MRIVLVLAATVAICAAECTQCEYTDISGQAVSTCSANANHLLKCQGTDKITSGEATFDNIACSGTEWFGLTCDGKVASLGASVAVSCPFNCGTSCSSVPPTDPALAPIDDCFDNKQMKSCIDGDLSIEIDSVSSAFSKAVCIGNNNWLAFNCDGSMKKVAGPLTATCPPPPPPTTVAPPTTTAPAPKGCSIGVYDAAVCTAFYNSNGQPGCQAAIITPTSITCPPHRPVALELIVNKASASQLSEEPEAMLSVRCDEATGEFIFTRSGTDYEQSWLETNRFYAPIGVACAA